MHELPEDIEWEEHILVILSMFGINSYKKKPESEEYPCHIWAHDENYVIVYWNHYFREAYRPKRGSTCHQLLHQREEVCGCCKSKKGMMAKKASRCAICRRNGKGVDINIYHAAAIGGNEKSLHVKSSTFVCRGEERAEVENETKVNIVQCAHCHKIRIGKNRWNAIPEDIIFSLHIPVSHGICPSCARQHYPDLVDFIDWQK